MFGKLGKGAAGIEARKLPDLRLHVRAIVRDGTAAFIGSQSLRKLELDGRREIGVIVSDERVAKKIRDVFESDWALTPESKQAEAAAGKEKEKKRRKARRLLPARDHAAVEDLPRSRDGVEPHLVAVDLGDPETLI
jgi:phosphatidylserine/phosphatidylglycerophosphate/cardiolipin synthase-like enzyme